jgi:hypothetical protein
VLVEGPDASEVNAKARQIADVLAKALA